MSVYYEAGRIAAFTKLGVSFKGLFGRGAQAAKPAADDAMSVMARRNAEMRSFTPQPLPPMRNIPAEQAAQAVPSGIKAKSTPTQAIDQGQLAQHLSRQDPSKAIQAATQYGMPIGGTQSVLDSLQSMPFSKLSTALKNALYSHKVTH